MSELDLKEFFVGFHDHLAPRLDVYEQAIYFYIFRHSRLIGHDEAVLGFKSARTRMALGVGQARTPMSESSVYKKLSSLEQKGCIKVIQTEHKGRRLRLFLPKEISGVVPTTTQVVELDIEEMDFFEVPEN